MSKANQEGQYRSSRALAELKKNDIHKVRLKERYSPREYLDVKLPFKRFSCHKGQLSLNSVELGMEEIHDGKLKTSDREESSHCKRGHVVHSHMNVIFTTSRKTQKGSSTVVI